MKQNILLLFVFGWSQIAAQNHSPTDSTLLTDSKKERSEFKRSKERLLAIPKLMVWLPDCDFKTEFKVVRFECFIETKKENLWFNNQGEKYSPELIEAFQMLKPGDKVYFDQIVCVGTDHRMRNIGTTRVSIVP